MTNLDRFRNINLRLGGPTRPVPGPTHRRSRTCGGVWRARRSGTGSFWLTTFFITCRLSAGRVKTNRAPTPHSLDAIVPPAPSSRPRQTASPSPCFSVRRTRTRRTIKANPARTSLRVMRLGKNPRVRRNRIRVFALRRATTSRNSSSPPAPLQLRFAPWRGEHQSILESALPNEFSQD